MFDLLISGGALLDGSGSEARQADVGISGERVAAIGALAGGESHLVLDATGLLVTPGFIDVHSHLDGNVTWESQLKPNSGHGITSTVMGNCGVGFAPCRPQDRRFIVDLMEGVEDIPAPLLHSALPWSWESFPEYLDVLRSRRFDMNVASLLPHSCLRVYVMGERAIRGEAATATDIAEMACVAREALAAGAVGIGSTRLLGQKTRAGTAAPSQHAAFDEYLALGAALGEADAALQIAPEFNQFPRAVEELAMAIEVARRSGCTVTYSLKQTNGDPNGWRKLMEMTLAANDDGLDIRPQVLGRPTGAIFSWETSTHPFFRTPSYRAIEHLPLEERLAELCKPAVRAAIVAECEARPGRFAELFNRFFIVGDAINYEPAESDSVLARAEAQGRSVAELLFDGLMANDGRGQLLLTSGNYAEFSLEPMLEMMRADCSILGLGDAGAHCTVICDASAPTYMLTYWSRDRSCGERLALPQVIRKLTAEPAELYGFEDRGRVQVGAFADLNVIDYEGLELGVPQMHYDLPAGGRRLLQPAQGYGATIVNGELTYRDGELVGAFAGRLL